MGFGGFAGGRHGVHLGGLASSAVPEALTKLTLAPHQAKVALRRRMPTSKAGDTASMTFLARRSLVLVPTDIVSRKELTHISACMVQLMPFAPLVAHTAKVVP